MINSIWLCARLQFSKTMGSFASLVQLMLLPRVHYEYMQGGTTASQATSMSIAGAAPGHFAVKETPESLK